MKYKLFRKGTIFVIVMLFVGAGVIPCFGGEEISNCELMVSNEPLVQPLYTGESYFIMLSNYSDSGESNSWAVQVRFDSEEEIVESEFDDATLPLITDQWVEIKVNIDLDTDWMEIYYDGDLLHEKNWTATPSNDGSGSLNIAAVDLYANSASSVFYDDLSLEQVGGSVVWSEDFDSYEDESSMHGQGGWKGWENDENYTAYVSSIFYRSSPHSVDVVNNSDLVHEYSGYTSGEYVYIAWMYIPENEPPNEPSDPNPEDGATDVSIYTNLSWTGGDPNDDDVTYNVFFEEGDETPDVLVSENQTETIYEPGDLEFGTSYYWQIVAYDELGLSATGEVWDFTTRTNDAPYTPSDPSPADGAVDIEINVDLSWSGGDPDGDEVTYDVYFGTSSPPPLAAEDITEESYDPGILEFDTTYYWQIVAWDIFDYSATGPIWSFTTEENLPPYEPSDPDPPDGATGVNIEKILTWTGGDPNTADIVTYDVYFGTSSPPPLEAEGLTQAAYDPGTMVLDTKYYWQIVSEDSQGLTTSGPIWSFTTEEEPNEPPNAPDIDGPLSGDPGTSYDFIFNAVDPDGHDVKYYIDWGDGNTDETGLNPSGEDVTVSHTWTKSGKYTITAYAEDSKGSTGPSSTFQVTMPKDKAFNSPFLQFLHSHPYLFLLLQKLIQQLGFGL